METTNTLYSSSFETSDPGTVLILAIVYLVLVVGAYIISALLLGRIFKKAGLASWPAWVPIYNSWKLFEIGGQGGWWAILSFIPFVNFIAVIFMWIAMYHIGLKLGKSGAFVLLAIFLPLVWLIWLAVDSSTWNDKASSAPSVANGPYPAGQAPTATV